MKQTSSLIPMCHPLPIQKCAVDFELDQENSRIHAYCTVKTEGKTGVEMEALTGVQTALLTIYDMCKAIDKHMVMSEIHLVEKQEEKAEISVLRTNDRPLWKNDRLSSDLGDRPL